MHLHPDIAKMVWRLMNSTDKAVLVQYLIHPIREIREAAVQRIEQLNNPEPTDGND